MFALSLLPVRDDKRAGAPLSRGTLRAATLTEIAPVAAARPAAARLAALIVEETTEGGTDANTACWDNTPANAPPGTARPRRASRFASIALAVRRRVERSPS